MKENGINPSSVAGKFGKERERKGKNKEMKERTGMEERIRKDGTFDK